MNCKKCGAPIENNSGFCGMCGTPVEPQINNATNIFNMGAPVQPAEPAQPAAPAQPIVEPATPAQPIVEPVVPIQPIEPAQPVAEPIVEPAQPVVEPIVEPAQPAVPAQPIVEPVKPMATLEPETIQQPNQLPIMDTNNGVVPPIDIPSTQPTSNDIEPEKKKGSALPIILVILILLGVGGFFAYKYFFNKPDKVVKSLINRAYDKFETPIKSISGQETVLTTSELSINTNIPGLEDLNTMKFNITAGIDSKNNKYEFGLSYLEDNKELLNALMYLLNEDAYVVLKDIYSNPLKLDINETDLEEFKQATATPSTEDVEYVFRKLKDILIDSLDSNDFKQSTDTITLNGSETKVKKTSYILDEVKYRKLNNNMVDNMLKDEEFLNKLAEMTQTDVETLKESLKDSKIENDLVTSDSETARFDIYTKGMTDEFVGMDIELPDNSNIKIRKNNNDTTISANIDGVSIVLTSKDESENKSTIDVKISVAGQEITGLITVEKNDIDSKTSETKTTFNIKYEEYEIEILLNSRQQTGVDIASIDVSNAKAIDELTEEESEIILQKLEEKLMDSKLYNLVDSVMNNLLGGIEQNYYDDYDYDYSA